MNRKVLSIAISIALLPPIWAVASGHMGVRFGATALICAALYTCCEGQKLRGIKLSSGFLLGDLWAVLSLIIMEHLPLHPDVSLYITLFIMGGAAVVLGALLNKITSIPAWLCGLAIGLTILTITAPGGADIIPLPVQIGIAMLAGIWYVGFVGDRFADLVYRLINKKKN